MIYDERDIDFKQITPKEFENLCYELVVSYGFQSVQWRQGGADEGRDIEAKLLFNSTFTSEYYTKWFFECKHYTGGVPAEELNSKIAWADAEQPDFLVLFITSHLTNSARNWLSKIQPQKNYKIVIVEGEELKNRIVSFQNLIPKYFSADKYIKLFEEIKRHNFLYDIMPSYTALLEIIPNIPSAKLSLNDVCFLLISFYREFNELFDRDEHYEHEQYFVADLFERLKTLSNQANLKAVIDNYDYSDSYGFLGGPVSTLRDTEKNYQAMQLLKTEGSIATWEYGYYLFVVVEGEYAVEIFMAANQDAYTFIHYDYNEKVLRTALNSLPWPSDEEGPVDYVDAQITAILKEDGKLISKSVKNQE